ncbi:uncharacterized protein DSM5745_09169 [Aspergillus mulundensis]|uniref:Uncharacterized protein n=1 Tax=Aspergillus mulundensis TaxID=1810919 RepID=A0A3D8QZR7_9EURO|nr:hypothetical protein DSM5745_09169 [Aspergillus mulundensis]RDW67303.1 hypothetical protein DSM5745_09169 [Aspergillus mulundensis]
MHSPAYAYLIKVERGHSRHWGRDRLLLVAADKETIDQWFKRFSPLGDNSPVKKVNDCWYTYTIPTGESLNNVINLDDPALSGKMTFARLPDADPSLYFTPRAKTAVPDPVPKTTDTPSSLQQMCLPFPTFTNK